MTTSSPLVINRTDTEQRTRFTCPEGHENWTLIDGECWCRGCSPLENSPTVYKYIRDQRVDRDVSVQSIAVVLEDFTR